MTPALRAQYGAAPRRYVGRASCRCVGPCQVWASQGESLLVKPCAGHAHSAGPGPSRAYPSTPADFFPALFPARFFPPFLTTFSRFGAPRALPRPPGRPFRLPFPALSADFSGTFPGRGPAPVFHRFREGSRRGSGEPTPGFGRTVHLESSFVDSQLSRDRTTSGPCFGSISGAFPHGSRSFFLTFSVPFSDAFSARPRRARGRPESEEAPRRAPPGPKTGPGKNR